jgi:hypothetical protein
MPTRRTFIQQTILAGCALFASGMAGFVSVQGEKYAAKDISDFAKRLNPIIDYSKLGNNRQLEDGNVFMEDGRFYMLARDMGRFDQVVGIILVSDDGIHWSEPKISYFGYSHYMQQAPAPSHLKKYGRFERPQILIQNGKPTHLFVASQGGKYMTSSAFVFDVK